MKYFTAFILLGFGAIPIVSGYAQLTQENRHVREFNECAIYATVCTPENMQKDCDGDVKDCPSKFCPTLNCGF